MRSLLSLAALCVAIAPTAEVAAFQVPGVSTYHVGFDNAPGVGFGFYEGLPNPNYQRLVLLYSHFIDNIPRSHFHRIGAYSYSGGTLDELGNVVGATDGFSTNNAIPEPYQADDGLALLAGSGAFDGKMISGLAQAARPSDEIEEVYGDLGIAPIDALFVWDNAPGPVGGTEFAAPHYLLNASRGAYKNSIADVEVAMKLVGLTPGLTIHDDSGAVLMDEVDDTMTLGQSAGWSFDPVFAIDSDAPLGSTYEATFILQDMGGVYGDSAEFSFRFIAAPEPTTAMMCLGAMAVCLQRRR